MPLWTQHFLVLTLVGACLIYTLFQGARSLVGKKSRLGSCCAKGCPPVKAGGSNTEKIHFLPVEMLRKRR